MYKQSREKNEIQTISKDSWVFVILGFMEVSFAIYLFEVIKSIKYKSYYVLELVLIINEKFK